MPSLSFVGLPPPLTKPVFNVLTYGVKGDGSVDDTGGVSATIAAATILGGTIYFPPGVTALITSNLITPVNVQTWFDMGAKVKIGNGVTFTFNGPVVAPPTQVFLLIGSGVVAFSGSSRYDFYPEWWGAVGDGVTDDSAAINAMTATVRVAGGGRILFSVKTYMAASSLNFQNQQHTQIYGMGVAATTLRWNGATNGTLIDYRGAYDCFFGFMKLDANNISGVTAVLMDGNPSFNAVQWDTFFEVQVGEVGFGFDKCFKIGATAATQCSELTFYHVWMKNYVTYGIWVNTSNAFNIWMYGLQFMANNAAGTNIGLQVSTGTVNAFGCTWIANNLDINIVAPTFDCSIQGFHSEGGKKFCVIAATCVGQVTISRGGAYCTAAGAGPNAIEIGALGATANGPIVLDDITIGQGLNVNVAVGFKPSSLYAHAVKFTGGSFTGESFNRFGRIGGTNVTTPGIPATGVYVQNTNPYMVRIYITLNSVTAMAMKDPDGNGFGIPLLAEVDLDPGAQIVFTYAGAAPTWQWYAVGFQD